jgi:hypothetical protein
MTPDKSGNGQPQETLDTLEADAYRTMAPEEYARGVAPEHLLAYVNKIVADLRRTANDQVAGAEADKTELDSLADDIEQECRHRLELFLQKKRRRQADLEHRWFGQSLSNAEVRRALEG